MYKDKVLVIGNGINRLNNNYSWKQLLKDIVSFAGENVIANSAGKPFPLFYEEIYLRALKQSQKKENDLKSFISKKVSQLEPNEIHQKITSMNFNHILTTNYDYALEKTLPKGLDSTKVVSRIMEKKYSVLRARKFGPTTLWHIHGEQDIPNSLTLGYEHYSGYLQKLRNYVISGLEYKKEKIPSLLDSLKKRNTQLSSWIDLFFQKDIYFLGLGLDFAEIHLWWLLTFIARKKAEKKSLIPNNSIFYFFPESEKNKYSARFELLEATNVKLIAQKLSKNNWKSFYFNCLKHIEFSA